MGEIGTDENFGDRRGAIKWGAIDQGRTVYLFDREIYPFHSYNKV